MQRIAKGIAALLLGTGACVPAATLEDPLRTADAAQGELAARPRQATVLGKPGLITIENPGGRSGLLYVPAGYRAESPAPLVVMLHGAGGTARHSIELARGHADRLGFILFAPSSAAASWDIISAREYGPGVSAIDGGHAVPPALARMAFDRFTATSSA